MAFKAAMVSAASAAAQGRKHHMFERLQSAIA
jgi:hypothetical protein